VGTTRLSVRPAGEALGERDGPFREPRYRTDRTRFCRPEQPPTQSLRIRELRPFRDSGGFSAVAKCF